MVKAVKGTCVEGLPGPKHSAVCGKGNVICWVSVWETVSITWTAPSSAPTKSKSPVGLSDAFIGTALPASEMTDEVCVARLNTMTKLNGRGGFGGGCSPRM